MTAKDSLRVRMGLVELVSWCLSPTWSHYLSLMRPSSGLLPSAVSYPPARVVLCSHSAVHLLEGSRPWAPI